MTAQAYRFDGRCVAVTGAGGGLGEAYARHLADLGATVIVADIGDTASTVAQAITAAGGRAHAVVGDLRDPDTSAHIIERAISQTGHIDALINNAGVGLNRSFSDSSPEDFQRLLDVHFFGTLRAIKAAWPHMTAAGYGRIVNIVSTTLYGFEGWSAYAAAKGAIFGMTRTLALEAKPLGINVNMIAPGAATPMVFANEINEDTKAHMVANLPPSAVAPTAAFLAHETCTTNGLTWLSSGGVVAPIVLASNGGATMASPDIAGNFRAMAEATAPLTAVGSVQDSMSLR